MNDIDTTCAICGPDATLENYFQHIIPCRCMGNDAVGTTLLHTLLPSSCEHPGCDHDSHINSIKTSWPSILNITPETVGGSIGIFNRNALPLPCNFRIQDVQYKLVERTHHDSRQQHYTCNRPIGLSLYTSDDMLFGGNFINVGSADLLYDVDFTMDMLVYHRVTDSQVSKLSALSQNETRADYKHFR